MCVDVVCECVEVGFDVVYVDIVIFKVDWEVFVDCVIYVGIGWICEVCLCFWCEVVCIVGLLVVGWYDCDIDVECVVYGEVVVEVEIFVVV